MMKIKLKEIQKANNVHVAFKCGGGSGGGAKGEMAMAGEVAENEMQLFFFLDR